MKPRLLKSFIVVVVFWFLATSLWWSLQQPSEIQKNLEQLQQFLNLFTTYTVDVPEHATILNSLFSQLKIFKYWSIPVLCLTALSFFIGVGFVALLTKKKIDTRAYREQGGKQNFRGVTVTVGDLPMPYSPHKQEISLEGDERFAKLNHLEKVLIEDIMGVISAEPDAFPGEGITTPLVDHCLNLLDESLNHPKYPGLTSVVVLGRELGKLTAYAKAENGTWKLSKKYERECGKLIMALESWNNLPFVDKSAVLMAILFHENPNQIPIVDGNAQIYSLARELIKVSESTQTPVVQEEKRKTLEKTDLPDVIFEAFLKSLPSLSFQSRGLPKGVAAVAWKFGNRLYIIEIKLRETIMSKLPPEIKGALTSKTKEGNGKVDQFTVELLKALRMNNWLITAVDNMKVADKAALWKIKAGKLDFNGVIIVEVPEQYMSQLPTDDSMYEVIVTGPLFTSSATIIDDEKSGASSNTSGVMPGAGFSKNDLGGVLKPSSKNATSNSAGIEK